MDRLEVLAFINGLIKEIDIIDRLSANLFYDNVNCSSQKTTQSVF